MGCDTIEINLVKIEILNLQIFNANMRKYVLWCLSMGLCSCQYVLKFKIVWILSVIFQITMKLMNILNHPRRGGGGIRPNWKFSSNFDVFYYDASPKMNKSCCVGFYFKMLYTLWPGLRWTILQVSRVLRVNIMNSERGFINFCYLL